MYEGKGGTIYTKEIYDNFVVDFEFQLPDGGNNGLAIRYPGKAIPLTMVCASYKS